MNKAWNSPATIEAIELPAGPRDLPDWARDAHINWMEPYSNRPALKVRCRTDPLAFSNAGNPVWEKVGKDCWIAERDGVAAVHYHGGQVREVEFQRHLGWLEKPGPENKFKGVAKTEAYTMLATPQSEGYAGRHFDVTLKDGQTVRLRGPWHGPSPAGFVEISFDTDEAIAKYGGRPGSRWWRPWHQRGGYFGLYIRPELLLDIFATFLPHVSWCWTWDKKGRLGLEPLRPETGLPKGWMVEADQCPGHRFARSPYGGKEHPGDRCAFCNQKRDPNWIAPWERKKA